MYHCCLSLLSFRIWETMRAPCRGGLEYMGRAMACTHASCYWNNTNRHNHQVSAANGVIKHSHHTVLVTSDFDTDNTAKHRRELCSRNATFNMYDGKAGCQGYQNDSDNNEDSCLRHANNMYTQFLVMSHARVQQQQRFLKCQVYIACTRDSFRSHPSDCVQA